MMRRIALVAVVIAGASVASAQMPPSISKPIDAARKNVNATNAQTAAVNQQPAKPAVAAPQAKPPQGKPPQARPAQAPVAAKPPVVQAPAGQVPSAKSTADTSKVTFLREVFTYIPRETDPFASPMETGAIRPLIADLRVVGIIYDPAGRNSVVVMRDQSTQQQYRAKVGQILGRAKVSQIKPQEVVMSIDEYGFSRQEILKLNTQQTQQTKGKP